jgi:hypothetical protein
MHSCGLRCTASWVLISRWYIMRMRYPGVFYYSTYTNSYPNANTYTHTYANEHDKFC